MKPKIIAVDGLYLRGPIDYTGFELAPGNRIDLDLTFDGSSSGTFPVVDRFYPQRPNLLATLQVDGIAPSTPAFASPAAGHVPEWSEGLSMPVTEKIRLNSRAGGPFGIEWTLNDKAFSGHQHHDAPLLTMKRGSWNRLQFTNESYRLHPMHLHGMFFRLLARNGVAVNEPFFRDTVLVHPRETVDVGLVPLDSGNWMMHCHILEHAEAGMMSTLEVKD